MGASNGSIGYGMKFQCNVSGTFVDLCEITKVADPSIQVDDVELTHSLSPSAAKEFTAGLLDGGEATVEGNFTNAAATSLYALFRLTKPFKILFADGAHSDFNGYIKAYNGDHPNGDKRTISFTVKVSGLPTWANT